MRAHLNSKEGIMNTNLCSAEIRLGFASSGHERVLSRTVNGWTAFWDARAPSPLPLSARCPSANWWQRDPGRGCPGTVVSSGRECPQARRRALGSSAGSESEDRAHLFAGAGVSHYCQESAWDPHWLDTLVAGWLRDFATR